MDYSMSGDVKGALQVASRLRAAGVPMTVHVYNGLIAACERAQEWDKALALQRAMEADRVAPNPATRELMAEVGRKVGGVQEVGLAMCHLASGGCGGGGPAACDDGAVGGGGGGGERADPNRCLLI